MAEGKKFSGVIKAEVIEARFAFSGKVENVFKKPGNAVKIGEFLATLDRKLLQTTLDKELADFEKIRAEFEIFGLKNPNPGDDITKYQKVQTQATLNAAVKAVEIAKYNLDEADLKSPVAGIILDNNGLRTGMYVTPGSYAYQILDNDSIHVEIEISSDERDIWEKQTQFSVLTIVPNLKGKLVVYIKPENPENMVVGSEMELELE
jgi:multidrug resistance efflux pump